MVAWCGIIFLMSSQSKVPEPGIWLPPHTDKFVHAVIYAILSCLIYPVLRCYRFTPIRAAWIAVLLASLYGITDEWHQSLVANRTADIFDWMADAIGACAVFALVRHEDCILRWVNK